MIRVVNPVIADTDAAKYLDIIAVHNYGDNGITAGGGTANNVGSMIKGFGSGQHRARLGRPV